MICILHIFSLNFFICIRIGTIYLNFVFLISYCLSRSDTIIIGNADSQE